MHTIEDSIKALEKRLAEIEDRSQYSHEFVCGFETAIIMLKREIQNEQPSE